MPIVLADAKIGDNPQMPRRDRSISAHRLRFAARLSCTRTLRLLFCVRAPSCGASGPTWSSPWCRRSGALTGSEPVEPIPRRLGKRWPELVLQAAQGQTSEMARRMTPRCLCVSAELAPNPATVVRPRLPRRPGARTVLVALRSLFSDAPLSANQPRLVVVNLHVVENECAPALEDDLGDVSQDSGKVSVCTFVLMRKVWLPT